MIQIKKNPNGDSRTAPKDVTFEQFQEANDMHRDDVASVMNHLAHRLQCMGTSHDWTKKSHEKLFYNDFLATKNDGVDFVSNDWYQLHINLERHHLTSNCHEDVNLLDVIEMIVDCVCAGKARNGEVRELEINDEILKKALDNTVTMLNDMIVAE